MNKWCKIAEEIERKYGIKACCLPYQEKISCPNIGSMDDAECAWGSPCPICGDKRVWSHDNCYGWHELCLNPNCGVDK